MKWQWRGGDNKELRNIVIPDWERLGAQAAFSSRTGGVSAGACESLNLALHVGDDKENVINNRKKFLNALGGDLRKGVACAQVHGHTVKAVEERDCGRGMWDYESALPDCDALITAVPDVFLMTFYADCFPVYLFDPEKKVIGLAHSGWKGTLAEIGKETVKKMREILGSRPDDIQVFIGPGIQACCFEIQAELQEKVMEKFHDKEQFTSRNGKGALIWDLPATINYSCRQAGVKESNIFNCGLCSSCRKEIFFSYRRDKGFTGRMGAAIALKK
ncbi:MAG: peptidoglycan editing factor PgeF [Syntrophomonadaceae bacterium]|nr:peptidoglycan editing factor PgeF [Syntrophomonadaceae bacterium]